MIGGVVSYCVGKITEIAITHALESSQTGVLDRTKADEAEKEGVKDVPDDVVYIYRYGSQLYPTAKDVASLYPALSFTTKEPLYPGYYMTTLEAINSTGRLIAVRDNQFHVSVYPVGYTLEDWHYGGNQHPCTILLKSICIRG